MLTAAGLVDYDSQRGLVEPTKQFEKVQPQLTAIIEVAPELESPVTL